MSRSLELPENIYHRLVHAASASGTAPAGWILERLPDNAGETEVVGTTDQELAAADASLDECLVSPAHPLGTDNEQIDADLAREYGNDHSNHAIPPR
ncbi:hypothetical protein BH10PLA2_BH10PLA2_11890 [soil metagenome]